MKRFIAITLFALFTIAANAQEVTKFLGIPVDGSKSSMINKLKSKGFTESSYDKETLEGEFNGRDVYVTVGTNRNKVYRIMVQDKYGTDPYNTKINYNQLCQQFANNPKYYLRGGGEIGPGEEVTAETTESRKYEVYYYQKLSDDDTLKDVENRVVWVTISKHALDINRYSLLIYYDNILNQANGDEL